MRHASIVLFAASALAAQTEDTPPALDLHARAERLIDLALEGRAHALLSDLLRTAPMRLSGSPGNAAAVQWGLRTMRQIGLQNVRAEEVMVPCWQRGEVAELALHDGDGDASLPIVALGGSVATPPEGVRARVLMVRTFEELQQRAAEAKGRIVFFNRPMPRVLRSTFRAYGEAVPQRTNGAVEASGVGGVAALVRSMTTATDDAPHTGALRYADVVRPVPAAAISTRGADQLAERLARHPDLELTLRLDCRTLPDVASANVVGEIPGRVHADQIVLIGAHLDAWDVGHGAHDDGAGVAHCLEAVRLLLAAGLRPARTVRVCLFNNEENGLRGGRAYARAHADDDHVAAVETDRGGFAPRGFTTSADDAVRSRLAAHLEPLAALDMGALLPGGGGADISPLAERGVPLFGLLVNDHRYFDFHHSAHDVIDAVHERELALGAATLAYLASVLAEPALWSR